MSPQDPDTRFEASVGLFVWTGVVGSLLMCPIAIGAALGMPTTALLGYLALAAPLLFVGLIRRVRRMPK